MRILCMTTLFWPNIGGIETLLMNSVPFLKDRGHEILILTSTSKAAPDSRDEFEGIPVYRYPMLYSLQNRNMGEIIKTRQAVAKLKRDYQADLVHLNFGSIPITYFHMGTLDAHQCPTLVTMHGGVSGFKTTADTLLGKMLSSVDWISTVSDAVMEDIIAAVPEFTNKTSRIYNGVKPQKSAILPLDFTEPQFVCIGRMVEEKGFDLLIDAFQKLCQDYPEANLILAGDGHARQDLESLTIKLGLEKNITFTGWVDPEKISELINQSVAVVVPSRCRESFGLVAVEAALMERPVIATRIAGLTETVVDGVTGILFENENVDELYCAMSQIISSPEIATCFGKAGREYAGTRFAMDSYIEAYDNLYKKFSIKEIFL